MLPNSQEPNWAACGLCLRAICTLGLLTQAFPNPHPRGFHHACRPSDPGKMVHAAPRLLWGPAAWLEYPCGPEDPFQATMGHFWPLPWFTGPTSILQRTQSRQPGPHWAPSGAHGPDSHNANRTKDTGQVTSALQGLLCITEAQLPPCMQIK